MYDGFGECLMDNGAYGYEIMGNGEMETDNGNGNGNGNGIRNNLGYMVGMIDRLYKKTVSARLVYMSFEFDSSCMHRFLQYE